MYVCTSQLVQESLASKVNVDDLTSLMPRDSEGAETSSLMSKLLEIQNRLSQLEGLFQEHSQICDLGLRVRCMLELASLFVYVNHTCA